MPHAPRKSDGFDYPDNAGNQDSAEIYRAVYREAGVDPLDPLNNRDVTCAVCTVPSADVLMIPARVNCPAGYTIMYHGYLFSPYYDTTTAIPSNYHEGEFVCVDQHPDWYPSQSSDTSGYLMFPVEIESHPYAFAGYRGDYETACVVCAMDYTSNGDATGAVATVACPEGQAVQSIDYAGQPVCVDVVLDPAEWQARVTATCPEGSSVRVANADGTVECQANPATPAAAGAGAVAAACPAGRVLQSVDAQGRATCVDVQQPPVAECPDGSSMRVLYLNGTVACEEDTVVPASAVQAPLAAACPPGEAIRAIASDGTITCTGDRKNETRQVPSRLYVEFARTQCSQGTTVYSGWAAGGYSGQTGSGVDLLCMHPHPEVEQQLKTGTNDLARLYDATFKNGGDTAIGTPWSSTYNNQALPCAVCSVPEYDEVLVVPGRTDCHGHADLTVLYQGWLMASRYNDVHHSRFECLNGDPEALQPATTGTGHDFYPVRVVQQPNNNNNGYTLNKAATCSVCGLRRPAGVKQATTAFTQWGRTTCPAGAAELYRGWVASSYYSHAGSGASQLCMPFAETPNGSPTTSTTTSIAQLYRTEYYVSSGAVPRLADNGLDLLEVPCAVCAVPGHAALTVPGWHECPAGWTEQYDGWLMAEHQSNAHNSEYICVHYNAEALPDSEAGSQPGNRLYTAEVYLPTGSAFSGYPANAEVACAVCTKDAGPEARLRTFVRWGREDCPALLDVETVYDGWAAGSRYDYHGSGYNTQCMARQPRYSDNGDYTYLPTANSGAVLTRALYQGGSIIERLGGVNNYEVPCAVCTVPSDDVVMVPGRINCPAGYTDMYYGYLMAPTNAYREGDLPVRGQRAGLLRRRQQLRLVLARSVRWRWRRTPTRSAAGTAETTSSTASCAPPTTRAALGSGTPPGRLCRPSPARRVRCCSRWTALGAPCAWPHRPPWPPVAPRAAASARFCQTAPSPACRTGRPAPSWTHRCLRHARRARPSGPSPRTVP